MLPTNSRFTGLRHSINERAVFLWRTAELSRDNFNVWRFDESRRLEAGRISQGNGASESLMDALWHDALTSQLRPLMLLPLRSPKTTFNQPIELQLIPS